MKFIALSFVGFIFCLSLSAAETFRFNPKKIKNLWDHSGEVHESYHDFDDVIHQYRTQKKLSRKSLEAGRQKLLKEAKALEQDMRELQKVIKALPIEASE